MDKSDKCPNQLELDLVMPVKKSKGFGEEARQWTTTYPWSIASTTSTDAMFHSWSGLAGWGR